MKPINILNCTDKAIPNKYYGFIYKTIFPNGKIYVGQTTKRVDRKYLGSGTKVKDFIDSKGEEGIKREILIFCKNQKILNKFEEVFITNLDCLNKNRGYNILPGAMSDFNPMKNPISVEKLIKFVLANHPFRGKRHSEKYKKNMSRVLKEREFSGINNPMFGKKPHNSGKLAINNGIKNRYISIDDEIPEGFVLGLRQNINKKLKRSSKVKVTITT